MCQSYNLDNLGGLYSYIHNSMGDLWCFSIIEKKYKWKRHDGKTKKIDHSGYNVPNLKGYSGWNCNSRLGEFRKTYILPIATQMEPGTNVKARTCEKKCDTTLKCWPWPGDSKSPNLANYLPVWNGICLSKMYFKGVLCFLSEGPIENSEVRLGFG